MVNRLPLTLRKFTRNLEKWTHEKIVQHRESGIRLFWLLVEENIEGGITYATRYEHIVFFEYDIMMLNIEKLNFNELNQCLRKNLTARWIALLFWEKVKYPKEFNYSIQLHEAARLLAVSIVSGERTVIDHCVMVINECYDGARVTDDYYRKGRIFEPAMVKLASKLYGTAISPIVAAVDCGIYDEAMASASDTARFSTALEACCVYHMKRSRPSGLPYEFDIPPFNLFPFEIWALMKLNSDAVVKHPIVSYWGHPKSFTLTDYRDEYVQAIYDICFTNPPKWPALPASYKPERKSLFGWLKRK